jgi:DNA-binding LytR/AlgR family response regulator
VRFGSVVENSGGGAPAEITLNDRLVLRDGGKTLVIALDEIRWIEAAGNYVEIYLDRRSHLVRHTVKAMDAKLPQDRFVRVRPSAIVGTAHVLDVTRRPGGDYVVSLVDGTEIRSSRGFRERIEARLVPLVRTDAADRWPLAVPRAHVGHVAPVLAAAEITPVAG